MRILLVFSLTDKGALSGAYACENSLVMELFLRPTLSKDSPVS